VREVLCEIVNEDKCKLKHNKHADDDKKKHNKHASKNWSESDSSSESDA